MKICLEINCIFLSFIDDPEIVIDYDYTDAPNCQLQKCKILFETIGDIIGRSTRTTLSLESNFYALGGNSLNSIFTVSKLRDQGYFIDISDFISAKNLNEMLVRMTDTENETQIKHEPKEGDLQQCVEPLAHEHKEDAIEYVKR